ncbi:hypothetical protein Tco_0680688, partial [Tanacetum coccineum]
KDEEATDVDVHLYRSMISSLMYLTASRLDIMFAVCACSRFLVTLKTSHLNDVKRIFRYLKGKPKLGLWYPRVSSFELEAYSDSDYAGANLDRKSTIGGYQFLGRRLISLQCKKQTIVASTTEAEYVAATNHCGQNPVFHSKTKYIEIRHHFIRDAYEKKLIQVLKIHTNDNVADLLTKAFDFVWNGLDIDLEATLNEAMDYTLAQDEWKTDSMVEEPKTSSKTKELHLSGDTLVVEDKGSAEKCRKTKSKGMFKEERYDTRIEDISEAEKKFKMLANDEEMARKVQEEWEAEEEKERLNADKILAEKIQEEEERENFNIEERAKLLHDTIDAQRRFLAQQRSEANKRFEQAAGIKKAASIKEESKEEDGTKKRKLGTRKKIKSRKRRFRQYTSKGDKTNSEKEDDKLRLCLTIDSDEDKEVDYEILDKKYPITEWKSEYLGIKPQYDETKDLEEINLMWLLVDMDKGDIVGLLIVIHMLLSNSNPLSKKVLLHLLELDVGIEEDMLVSKPHNKWSSVLIKQRIQAAQDRQKSYADLKRKPMEFEVGDRVMLKVSPWKGVVRFGKRGKLNPRYVGPFKVLAKVGKVAYRLELPQELSRVHHTFHVSNLKKCYADEPLAMPLEGIHVDDKLQFVEEPVEIMEREIKRLKRSRIPLVKVRWNSRRGPEFTWEREDSFKQKYPQLFTNRASSSTTRS